MDIEMSACVVKRKVEALSVPSVIRPHYHGQFYYHRAKYFYKEAAQCPISGCKGGCKYECASGPIFSEPDKIKECPPHAIHINKIEEYLLVKILRFAFDIPNVIFDWNIMASVCKKWKGLMSKLMPKICCKEYIAHVLKENLVTTRYHYVHVKNLLDDDKIIGNDIESKLYLLVTIPRDELNAFIKKSDIEDFVSTKLGNIFELLRDYQPGACRRIFTRLIKMKKVRKNFVRVPYIKYDAAMIYRALLYHDWGDAEGEKDIIASFVEKICRCTYSSASFYKITIIQAFAHARFRYTYTELPLLSRDPTIIKAALEYCPEKNSHLTLGPGNCIPPIIYNMFEAAYSQGDSDAMNVYIDCMEFDVNIPVEMYKNEPTIARMIIDIRNSVPLNLLQKTLARADCAVIEDYALSLDAVSLRTLSKLAKAGRAASTILEKEALAASLLWDAFMRYARRIYSAYSSKGTKSPRNPDHFYNGCVPEIQRILRPPPDFIEYEYK